VTPEVWYVAGAGLLVGADRRWLLLDDVPDEAFVSTLWETIAGSSVDRVLGVLESHYGDRLPSLAMSGAGREIARGAGQVASDRDGLVLSIGTSSDSVASGQRRPFRGGVVAAGLVEVPVDVPGARGDGPQLIDAVPDDVLAAVGPDVPVRTRQTARDAYRLRDTYPTGTRPPATEVETTGPIDLTRGEVAAPVAGAGDASGAVVRSSATDGPPQPVPEPEFELLREHTHETVMATYCPQGHVNPPYAPTCRVCQAPIARQDPQRAPRPLLGRLRLPTGETVPFDRGVVLGRKPVPVNPHAPLPHLVAVPQEASFVSRMHLQIELDGWLVICRDLGSRGGTTLTMPGRAPERLRAMEPHVLEPGCRVSLADQYEVAYEVTL
jgi:FHA domain